MSAGKVFDYEEVALLPQEKEWREIQFPDVTAFIIRGPKGHYAYRFSRPTRSKYAEETISLRYEGGKIKVLWDKVRAVTSEIQAGSGNLVVYEGKLGGALSRGEGLLSNVGCLPQDRAIAAESRGLELYDDVVAERNQLKVANSELGRRVSELTRRVSELARRLHERVDDQDLLRAALTARNDGKLRMTESYEGIVRHVGRDEVVVLFEVDDDLVEHTYMRDQFVDSRLPEKGDRLAVYVHVAQLPHDESAEGAGEATEGIDEQPRRRRNIGPAPREF